MKIHYEPHPVAPERKAELRALGVKIVDAQFAPADEAPADKPSVPRTRAKKAD